MAKKIKLSDNQKLVIATMRGGAEMTKNVTYVLIMGGCSLGTFGALMNKGMIKFFGKFKQGWGCMVVLTKLGKTIEL